MDKLTDYKWSYKVFKKLPMIMFYLWLAIAVLVFFLMIIDMVDFDLLLVIICVVAGAISTFFTSVLISPIVIIADTKYKEDMNED